MGYTRGSESSFTGLGSDITGMLTSDQIQLLKISNPSAYAEYLKKIDAAKLAQKLADAAIAKLKSDPKYGPVFSAAVEGATDPKAVAEKAKAWAEKAGASLSNLDQDALRLYYSQAVSGLNLLDDYISINPIARDVMKEMDKGLDIFGDTIKVIKSFQSKGADVSGIADAATLVSKTFSFANSIVQRAAKGSEGAKIFGEIASWTGIATGCAAGMSVNVVGGAFGCAAAVLVKMFDMLTEAFAGIPLQVQDPFGSKVPMGSFSPTPTQVPIITADAIRLASLLKYRYGVTSWASIANFGTAGTSMGYYPVYNPDSNVNSGPLALTPGDFEQVISNVIKNKYGVYPSSYSGGVGGGAGAGYRYHQTGVKPHRESFRGAGDRDIDAIMWGGKLAELMGAHCFSTGEVTLPFNRYNVYEDEWVCCAKVDKGINLQIEMIYSDLIKYFMALTVNQINDDIDSVKPILTGSLPVRYWYCAPASSNTDRPWPTDPREPLNGRYDPYIFTMMYPGTCDEFYLPANGYRGTVAMNGSLKGNSCAVREVAMIRLMAAASYIHMLYKWGRNPVSGVSEDMISGLDTMTSNIPGHMLRLPVDPSSKLINNKLVSPSIAELRSLMTAMQKKMSALQALAKAQAEADIKNKEIPISPTILAALNVQAVVSSKSDPIQQMIKSGQLNLQTFSQARLDCRNKGGEWFEGGAICDVPAGGGSIYNCRAPTSSDSPTAKRYYCVPKGTPGASQISASGQVSTGPGVGAVVAIAGAALLLMRLLKS